MGYLPKYKCGLWKYSNVYTLISYKVEEKLKFFLKITRITWGERAGHMDSWIDHTSQSLCIFWASSPVSISDCKSYLIVHVLS